MGSCQPPRREQLAWLRALPVVAASSLALALVGAGCGGTEAEAGSAAGIVPSGVPAFVSINTDTDSSQWQTAEALADKFPDKDKAIRELKKSMREEAGLSWEKDVEPALGDEIDLVWVDLANDGENIVGLMQPADKGAFKRAIEKGNATEDDPSDRLLYEEVDGWMVMSDRRGLIDRFRRMSESRARSLEDDATFAKAMDAGPDDALAKAYVDGRAVTNAIVDAGGSHARSFLERLGTLDWVTGTVAVKDDGVVMDTTVHGTPGEMFEQGAKPQPFEASLPERVPEDAVFYLTFHGTKGLTGAIEKNPVFQAPEARTVLSVVKRIGTLLQGENALYVRPAHSGRLPEVTLVTEPRPGTSGRATLDRIVDRFRGDLGTRPLHGTIAGRPATTLGVGDFRLHYADVGDKLVVTDLPAGIAAFEDGGASLSDSGTYKQTLGGAGMPDRTHGFLYVDISAGTGLVEKLSGTHLPENVRRNLRPLRSAVEYAASKTRQFSVTFFLQID